jgi:hypothetical protein
MDIFKQGSCTSFSTKTKGFSNFQGQILQFSKTIFHQTFNGFWGGRPSFTVTFLRQGIRVISFFGGQIRQQITGKDFHTFKFSRDVGTLQ